MTILVNMPLIVPLMAVSLLISRPYHAISQALSFFPLTAPLAMITRLAVVDLPAWQPALAAALLGLTALLVVRWTASLFRAQTMLQGQPMGRVWRSLFRPKARGAGTG